MTKIAIIGSRDYPNLKQVEDYLNELRKLLPCMRIITGGAKGVDQKAESWALGWGVECEVIKPLDPSDKLSYLYRNIEIITKADQIVAFWNGTSRGTKFAIDYANSRGRFVIVKTTNPLSLTRYFNR
jgi:hypothetical protein